MASVAGGPASGSPARATGPSDRAGPGESSSLLARILALREGSIIVVTLITAIYFAINTSTFLTGSNFKSLLPFFAPFAIMAAGEVFVMILGEIDLSIGAVYLFAPFVFYKFSTVGIPLVACVILALLCCMVVGAVNGFFTAVIGINSFVTTLGMLFTFEGLTLIISHGAPVETPGSGTFASIFGHGTYSELVWALAIVIVLQIVLTFTRWGIYTVSIGSNKLGAAEAGIGVKSITIRNFVLCSLTAGLVGVLEAVRAGSVQPDPGGANEVLLLVIASAVIGGTLLAGGSGTVIGALIGALFLGILKDGLILQGVNANYTLFYLGLAIVIAMTVHVYVQRVRRGYRSG